MHRSADLRVAVIGPVGFPAVSGGLTRHCEELYSRLAERGVDATMYTRRTKDDPREGRYRGMHVVALRVPHVRGLETVVYGALASVRALFGRFDVVHYHGVASGAFCWLQRLRPHRRLVFTHHRSDWVDEKWRRPARALLLWTARASLRTAHSVIAVSSSLASELRALRDREIDVIPNGVTLPDAGGVERLHPFGLTPGRYALCVGRIVPEKGVHVVIDAFRSLTDTGLDLAIVGAPRYSHDYAARLDSAGDERVHLVGQQTGEALGALYANAAVFVTASRNEGHPLAVLEAMGFGLPIVASDIPAHRELLDESGVLFETDDPVSLAAAIRTALTKVTEDPRAVIARNGYAWDAIAERTHRVLVEVVRGAHA